MKTLRLLLCALLAPVTVSFGQEAPGMPAPVVAESPEGTWTDEQLDQLLGPIALYPDALIALILPAATQPADIVLAARYLKERGNDLSQVENRAWDDSVKSLTHYPEVLKWMDENLTWTKQVGEAFAAQPAQVMNTVQRLRTQAQAAGTLVSTAQQQVIVQPTEIRIVPTEPDVIYVPSYDPTVVFINRPYYYYARPPLSFGSPYRVGSWLAYDFDWPRSTLWIGDRYRSWAPRHDWRRPLVPIVTAPPSRIDHGINRPPSRPWQPPTRRPSTVISYNRGQRPPPVQQPPAVVQPPPSAPRPERPLVPNRGYRSIPPTRTTPSVAQPTAVVPGAPTVVTPPAAVPGSTAVTSPAAPSYRGRTVTHSSRGQQGEIRTTPSATYAQRPTPPPQPQVSPSITRPAAPSMRSQGTPGFTSRGSPRPAPAPSAPAAVAPPAAPSAPAASGSPPPSRPQVRQSRN